MGLVESVICLSSPSKLPSEKQYLSTLSWPLYLIERGQRPVKQPAFLNLRDISNKSLVTGLENLMEDNPVGFPILIAKSATLPRHPTFRVYPQTSMSSDEHAE